MKRIANILSYLCLLLLLLVVACSDLEEITIGMLSDEEVELTIPTAIPSLGGSTRTAPAEDITSITALAFDSDHELVKVVEATLSDKITTSTINDKNYSTKGTMAIKVPARTRRIHFIAKNGADFEAITEDDYGRKDTDLLVDLTSDELHYWAMLEFESAADMQSLEDELGAAPNTEGRLTLVRNMAKITLDAGEGSYIAGILNYNVKGTIVPYKKDANDVYQFGYERNGTNHDLPSVFQITSDTEDRQLGTEHYMFEEFNDVGDLVYIICKIGTLYYKVAFVNPNADSSSSTKYYYIVRNRAYKIRIDGTLDTKFGRDSYESAVRDAKPINDTANEQVHIEFDQDVLYMFLDETATVKVTIPDGITTLKVGYLKEYFEQGGIIATTVSPTAQETETVKVDGVDKELLVDTYTVTGGTELEFTINLKDGFEHAIKDIQVQFIGSGEGKMSNDKLTIHALERGTLESITPKSVQILRTAGSQFTATVTIPAYTENVGNFELWVGTADGAFAVTPPENLRLLDDGYYDVAEGQTYTFTFTLNEEDGEAGEVKTVTYYVVTDFHRLIGTTTVTLVEEEIVKAIVATPSANSLNYAGSSVEDLWVKVTIPKEVNKLTFASDHFKIMATGGRLTATDGGYTVAHEEGATETITSVRIRLNDDVSGTAQFTFGGVSDKQNVTVQSATGNITLNNNGDANVRWQGNVPLNGNNYDAIVPLKYEWFESIAADSKLNLEFNVTGGDTSWLEVFEIQGETEEEWTNHNFEELNDDNRYVATGNGNTLSLTITNEILETIKVNFRRDFLGEDLIAMAIRGEGITLTKVSVVPPISQVNKILITAPGETEGVSNASVAMSYSNQSAIEEYTITVTVPDGVTQLNYTNNGFSNVYIDTDNWYTTAQSPITISDSKSIPLKLSVDKNNNNPTITFSANAAENATFTVNRTAGTTNSDVLWEGALQFKGYDVNTSKIAIPNNLLQGKLLDDAILTLEYEVVNDGGAIDIYGSATGEWRNLRSMAEDGEYTDNNSSTITLKFNPTIIENIGDDAINMQGDGRVLKKVTLTPPADVQFNVLEETVSLDLATNEVVLNVQKPANVTQLTITDNDNLFGTVSTTFANANVNGKTISNLPNDAATIPVKLGITRVVDIKNYTITVSTNDGRSDNVTINLLSTWSGSHNLGNWEGFWGSARKLPVGSIVQITFANYNNCSFELHTYKSSTDFGYDLRLEGYSTTELNNGNPEDYISTSHLTNGVFTFTVATDGSIQIRNNGNLSNVTDAGLDGLQINGGNGLSVTQVSVTLGSGEITPTGFVYNFDDGVKFGDWNNNISTEIVDDPNGQSNKVLKIVVANNEYNFGQLGMNGDYSESCTYTLSLRFRAESTNGTKTLVFQKTATEGDYPSRLNLTISDYTTVNSWKEYKWENVSLSGYADQFVIKFQDVDAGAVFYIDDLKLVRNN